MAQATISANAQTGNTAPTPFTFKNHEIRTAMIEGSPWFVAKDVATVLDIAWSSATLKPIPEAWRRMMNLIIRDKNNVEKIHKVTVISEPAVYKLGFRSNKPEADEFTNWVACEVLPAIRKTGRYEAQPTPTPELPARRATTEERAPLVTLHYRYAELLGGTRNREVHKSIWRNLHEVMGVRAIEELTVDQLPRAMAYFQTLIQAAEAQKNLPALSEELDKFTFNCKQLMWNLGAARREMNDLLDRLYTTMDDEMLRVAASYENLYNLGSQVLMDARKVDIRLRKLAEKGQFLPEKAVSCSPENRR